MSFFGFFGTDKEDVQEEFIQKQSSDFSSFYKIAEYIYHQSGITDLDKRALTSSKLQKFALSQEVYTTQDFLKKLEEDDRFYQEILNIATVNETYFFREEKELKWLINYIQNSQKKLRILSMPSSSGEEVYSILLMMLEKNISLDRVEIEGFDINSKAVEKAKNGIYDEHALHKIDTQLREKYFITLDTNSFQILQYIREKPYFGQKNIFEIESTQMEFDVVLSRNMFIYFDDFKRKTALDIIVKLLAKDGVYIKGHADNIYPHKSLKNLVYGIYSKQI